MAQAGTAYVPFQGQFDDLIRDAQRAGRRAAGELLAGFNGTNIGRDVGSDVNRGFGAGLGDLRRAGARAGDRFADGFNQESQRSVKSGMGKVVGLAAGAFAGLQVAGLFTDMIDEAREAAKVGRLTEAVIASTGGAAKLAASDVSDLASALSEKAGVDDEVIQAGANMLLTFTKVRDEVGEGNDIFSQATALALDYSAATGKDMTAAALQFGKALNDPIRGMAQLGKAGVQFSEDQKEQIRTMVESGDILGAQKMILAELETQFGGAAEAATDPIQKLSVMWGNFLEGVGAKILPWVEDIGTGIGERLPGLIDRGGAAIGELRDRAVEFGTDVWDRVQPAVEDLWESLQNLGRFGAEAWDMVEPLVKGLGLLGGAAVLASLRGVAAGLEAVTGFLADHTDQVLLAAAAYGAWKLAMIAPQIWAAGAAGVAALSRAFDTLAIGAYSALGPVSTLSIVAGGLAVVAGVAAGAYLAIQGSADNAREANEKFLESIDFDASSLNITDLNTDIAAMREEFRLLSDEADRSDWQRNLQTLNPFDDNTIEEARRGQSELSGIIGDAETRVGQLEAVSDALNLGAGLDLSADSIELWMSKLNFDPAKDSVSEIAEGIYNARLMAETGTPATEDLAAAYEVLGGEVATATEELQAWKGVMDSIMGVKIDYEEAQIDWARSIGDLSNALSNAADQGEAFSTNLFGGDLASLETRDMIAGLADEAILMAQSFGEAGGGVEGATWKLAELREQLIVGGEATGIARGDMEAYLDTLELTPENIATNLDLTGEEIVETAINQTTRGRTTPVDVAADMPSFWTLQSQLEEIARPRSILVDLYLNDPDGVSRPLTDADRETIDRIIGAGGGGSLPGFLGFARGGITPAHIAKKQMITYAEPGTGGEAFVPRFGDYSRSLGILSKAASWYGASVVPHMGFQNARGQTPTPALAAAPTVAAAVGRPSMGDLVINTQGDTSTQTMADILEGLYLHGVL